VESKRRGHPWIILTAATLWVVLLGLPLAGAAVDTGQLPQGRRPGHNQSTEPLQSDWQGHKPI